MLIHWLIVVLTLTTYVTADNNDNNIIVIEADVANFQPNISYRLPKNIRPYWYELEIKTYLDDLRFEGSVKITIYCFISTSEVILHSQDLNITENEVILKDCSTNKTIPILQHLYHTEYDLYIFKLACSLKAGRYYFLDIPFNASLSTNLGGYYGSSYIDKKTNQTRLLAATHFEPIDARRAFPCFDEPSMKAHFKVSLVHHSNYTSISNMPKIASEQLYDGWVKDVYQQSKVMSTYLMAFVIADINSLKSSTGTTKFQVWARPDKLDQGKYALDIGPKILAFFEQYFGIEYPLPKVDMVALPDHSSRAVGMENWGLITFQETAMLYEEGVSAESAKENVTYIISHELAHQWFGNLVTMRWWDDLWLNEGFATYVGAIGVNHVAPEWQYLDEHSLKQMLDIFYVDSRQFSHPVSSKLNEPSEIWQLFDAITYSKGSLLVRMMSHFLGEHTFRRGVTRYLRKYKLDNADQDALWACLEEQAKVDSMESAQAGLQQQQPLKRREGGERNFLGFARGAVKRSVSFGLGRGTVKQIMDSWTLQAGYPVVQVTRNYEKRTATVSQKRFLMDWDQRSDESSNALWWIPLSFTDSSHKRPRSWLHKKSSVFNDMPAKENWLLLNVNLTAIYRVNYDPENWRLLSAALHNSTVTRDKIPPLNRAQLIVDSLDLARAGQLDYNSALDILRYLRHERSYLPWKAAFSSFEYFDRRLQRNAGYGVFRSMMKTLLTPIYSELGFRVRDSTEALPNIKHRAQLLGWACRMGVGDCEKLAAKIFLTWKNQTDDPDTKNPIPADVRSMVYCSAVRLGGQEVWDFLYKRYVAAIGTTDQEEIILKALGCTREIWLLHKYLELSLDDTSAIEDPDAVFSSVARSASGFYVAREFFFTRFQEIYDSSGYRDALGPYIEVLSESMNTDEDLTQMQKFVEDNASLLKDVQLSIKQSLENIQLNVQWRSKYLNIVTDWLSQHANAAYFD